MPAGAAFRVLVAELGRIGLDPERVCAEANVDPAVVGDPSRPFGLRALGRVLARAEEITHDPHLGLHLAATAPGRGLLSYVFRAQPTIEHALGEMARVAALVWEQEDVVRIKRRAAETAIAFELQGAVSRHALEFVVARVAIGLRQSGAHVRWVAFRHDGAPPRAEYQHVLGVPVRFRRPLTALSIDSAALARSIPTANPHAAAALASGLDGLHAPSRASAWAEPGATRPAPEAAVSVRLTRAVERALAAGVALDRETMARELGMSGKTLARRLADEQQGFRAIVERTRRALAQRLVLSETIALGEVASRTGFADQAAFGKAFRRWFGASPGTVRARRRRP